MNKAQDIIAVDAAKAAQLIKSTAEQTATSINISYIQKDMADVKQSLKEITGMYVTNKDFADYIKTSDDHENRIRKMEENMWRWVGISSVVASVITAVSTFLLKLI